MTYFLTPPTRIPGANLPYLLRKGDGHNLTTSADGDLASIKASGAENDGRIAFLEYQPAVGGAGPLPHTHDHHEELFYVVSGRLHMLLGEQSVLCGPGDFAYVPRNIAHTFWNEGPEPCTFVAAFSPAGFERILERHHINALAGRIPTPEERQALAREFDLRVVDWPAGVFPHLARHDQAAPTAGTERR